MNEKFYSQCLAREAVVNINDRPLCERCTNRLIDAIEDAFHDALEELNLHVISCRRNGFPFG
jgi:hypothetical protein